MLVCMVRLIAACAALGILAACSGGSSNPCPNGKVGITAVPPPQLVSPASGATGVTASNLAVVISYDPPNGSLYVVAADGSIVPGAPLTPVPSPAGGFQSALPALAAHTTYTVHVAAVYPPPNPCVLGAYAGPTDFPIGTFTTQ
jgi:hypothetical protein